MLFMDSFYPTKESAEWLKSKNIMYVGAIQKPRFNTLCLVMEPELEKSGAPCIAHNSTTGKSVAFCWSANKKLGKNYVHTNAYKLKKRRKKTLVAPRTTIIKRVLVTATNLISTMLKKPGRMSSKVICTRH